MLAYYQERKRYMQLVYGSLILGKLGILNEAISAITYHKSLRDQPPLDVTYPHTPADDARFLRNSYLVIAQHTGTILALIFCAVLLCWNLKWFRRINPILLTFAFVFYLPVYQVDTTYYFVLNASANMAMSFLIPWTACETLAG